MLQSFTCSWHTVALVRYMVGLNQWPELPPVHNMNICLSSFLPVRVFRIGVHISRCRLSWFVLFSLGRRPVILGRCVLCRVEDIDSRDGGPSNQVLYAIGLLRISLPPQRPSWGCLANYASLTKLFVVFEPVVQVVARNVQRDDGCLGVFPDVDNEIDFGFSEGSEGLKATNIKPRRYFRRTVSHSGTVPASGRLHNLFCTTRRQSFVTSCSFTKQILVQLDWLRYSNETTAYKNGVYHSPKELHE